ncbi:helix-turn-helix domain-containing protein [Streptomyces sp. NPDC007991]|uniref:helix-turn-helix domain-containing protein n=1 Tax=Streptomyces sp. NPDC007991 TaxID=3364803 RepID=UPI0036F18A84
MEYDAVGRPEKPIPDPLSPLGRLATALRNGRRGIGLSYAELSERTGFHSPATLQRAASGTVVPKRDVACSFARACELDVDAITQLWIAAYRGSMAGRRTGDRVREGNAPRPHLIRDFDSLCRALKQLRLLNGAPSFQVMANRARAARKELSRSTANRICAGQPPASIECLEAFLIACEVPPRGHEAWFEAWLRAGQHATAARQGYGMREEMKQLEAVVAENLSGKVAQETAARLLRKAGFESLERYRRFEAPWTVECMQCATTFRVRLSDVVMGRASCLTCAEVTDHVREAWVEMLSNRAGLLSSQQVRALRAVTVLQSRLHRDHLDVPVFVTDRKTEFILQSTAWHPALKAALRRHIRPQVRLDVLLVCKYEANGRQRRLAMAAGLVGGPVETAAGPQKPHSTTGTAVEEPTEPGAERNTFQGSRSSTPPAGHTPQSWEATSNSGP